MDNSSYASEMRACPASTHAIQRLAMEHEGARSWGDGSVAQSQPARLLAMPFDRRVWAYIGERFYAGSSLIDLFRKAKLFALVLLKRSKVKAWHERPFGRHASEILWRHPLLPVTTSRPYIDTAWPLARKHAVIEGHYALLKGPRAVLDFPLHNSRTVARLDEIHPGLRVVMDKPCWFFNEGEVALNLFLDAQRVYSLVFTLGVLDGRMIAYLGALQGGGSGEAAVERNKLLTRAAHGMRPRGLLFANFRILCGQMEVERIYAPRDIHSVLRSSYFNGRRNAGDFDYDAAWTELGGTVCPKIDMFDIPTALLIREADEIPARKRALYSRRYGMLGKLESKIERFVSDGGHNVP